jgi:glucuronate isomerase
MSVLKQTIKTKYPIMLLYSDHGSVKRSRVYLNKRFPDFVCWLTDFDHHIIKMTYEQAYAE